MGDVGQQPGSCSSYAAAKTTSLPETSCGCVNRSNWITYIAIVGSSRHQTETRFAGFRSTPHPCSQQSWAHRPESFASRQLRVFLVSAIEVLVTITCTPYFLSLSLSLKILCTYNRIASKV